MLYVSLLNPKIHHGNVCSKAHLILDKAKVRLDDYQHMNVIQGPQLQSLEYERIVSTYYAFDG